MSYSNKSKPHQATNADISESQNISAQGNEDVRNDAHAPFSREDVMYDLRAAVVASANHILVMEPNAHVLEDFLGFKLDVDIKRTWGNEEIEERTTDLAQRVTIDEIFEVRNLAVRDVCGLRLIHVWLLPQVRRTACAGPASPLARPSRSARSACAGGPCSQLSRG